MGETITIKYHFLFDNNEQKEFLIALDADTLECLPVGTCDLPSWTQLSCNKCSICPLDEAQHKYCPVAVNLAEVAGVFKDHLSHHQATVTVTTAERTFLKTTSIQEGLSALIGIVMSTSGCPVLSHLKPMVRLHLPFATFTETIFRMASMYFMAQYFRKQRGLSAELDLGGFREIYARVGTVNRDFANRLKESAKKDANLNALVILDCFASVISMQVEDSLSDIEKSFAPYLNE